MIRLLKWLGTALAMLALLVLLALLIFSSSKPHSPEELNNLARRLNEAAAIRIPHHFLMREEERVRHLALLKRVEQGTVLGAEESKLYRKVFQRTLLESQGFLARFDAELTVLEDWRMVVANNVGGTGIAGRHDHHDHSARHNFADVEKGVAALISASGAFDSLIRMRAINLVNKSLADIISHMGVAPHTVSVPLEPPTGTARFPALSKTFEDMLDAYKQAQFLRVNSPAYWRQIDRAVEQYAALVGQVQQQVHAHSSWWERRMAGRFLAPQTLAPQIDDDIPFRR